MRFRRYAHAVLGVNLAVILWGALVRATGSGAGCGRHWPLCNGQVVPAAPGTATLIELGHRASSGLALVLVAVLFGWSLRAFPRGHAARRWAAASLLFIVIEALIGAGLVLLELVGANDSLARAGYLAGHLLNTFLLLGALALTAHSAAHNTRVARPAGSAPWQLGSALLLLLLVGMTGAIAALGDTLFPSATLAEGLRADSDPTAHLLVRLRGLHPIVALVAGLVTAGVVWLLARARPAAAASAWPRAVAGLLLLQLGLGAINLILLAPVPLQLGHLLVADLLWIAVVRFAATALAAPPAALRVSEPPAARAMAAVRPGRGPER